jgi:2-polyprenyl-3-methyl-5-hydroxy-6-metoxy-1,4-benzoquinol methylase/transcription elongation factor Elf1
MNKLERKSTNCPICGKKAKYDFTGQDFMFNKKKFYMYSKCRSCKISFQDPIPDLITINSYYPNDYENYDDPKPYKLSIFEKIRLQYHHGYKNIIKNNLVNKLLSNIIFYDRRIINNIPNGNFLDIGCGNGSRLIKMRKLGWNVFGVELNTFAYKKCVKRNLNVQNIPLENATFEKNSFDVIYMSHLIEHLHNPLEIIKICDSLLKEDGKLYIQTPNLNSLGRLIFGKFWFANEVPRHLILYSHLGIKKLIQSTGLEITHSSLKTSPKIILNSVDYLFDFKKPSKRNKILRFLSKIYVYSACLFNMGDESFYIIKKKKNKN